MNNTKYYLAIDLGATSGRHIIGYLDNGEITLKEVHRFKTGMDDTPFGLVWDIPRLLSEIIKGIKKAFEQYPKIESLSIDTWGVDYVLLNKDKEIPPFYAYRNERNGKAANKLHKFISFEELYKETGIQFAELNTIYQLYADLLKGRLLEATDYLMLPNYFTYKLTGVKTHEYTIESTTSLLNPYSKEYNLELIDKIGLPKRLFGDIKMPGTVVGDLLPSIQKEVGGNCKVILCPGHDTACAFESIDVPSDAVIISSGTWSLLGIKSKDPIVSEESLKANYTNEGGVGYIRFLKNIMGMWLVNETMKQVGVSFDYLEKNIKGVNYQVTFDVNDSSLLAPKNMKNAIMKLLDKCPPRNDMELFSSIYHSLALSYKNAIEELEVISKKKYNYIYIVGGGANNKILNEIIQNKTGKKVVAIPIEATSYGNIKIQAKS